MDKLLTWAIDMKVFIGTYYKTAKEAFRAWKKLPLGRKKVCSVCELDGSYFIVGNSLIKAFNKKSK
jgi:hypothetical protein